MFKHLLAAAIASALLAAPATPAFAQAATEKTDKADTKKPRKAKTEKSAKGAKKELTPQQQKMKDCAAKWGDYKKEKKVKGRAEYRKFMSPCLKG
jgi:Spy/CpxP family protein refolding chaperone